MLEARSLSSRVEKELFARACKTKKDITRAQILSVSLEKSRKTKGLL